MASAYTNLYVDTDIGAAGDGTSWAQAKATLATAVALLDANTEDVTIHCKGATADATVANPLLSSMASGKYLTIEGEYPGEWNTGKYRMTAVPAASNATLDIECTSFRVRGLQFGWTHPGDWNNRAGLWLNAAGDDMVVESCVFNFTTATGGSTPLDAIGSIPYAHGHATIRNCGIVFSDAGTAVRGVHEHLDATSTVTIQNCTIKNAGAGITQEIGVVTAVNCGFVACTDLHTGTVDHTANCSETTPTFASGKEFQLDTTDTTWKDQGSDLSGTFTGDITALTGRRSGTFDIGAYELQASGQFARPASDVADGTWLNEASSNTNLYASIDETTASDSDYIRSAAVPSNDTCTVGLSSISTPAAGTVTMRIRARFL